MMTRKEETQKSVKELLGDLISLSAPEGPGLNELLSNPASYKIGEPTRTFGGYAIKLHTESSEGKVIISKDVRQVIKNNDTYAPLREMFDKADEAALEEAIRKRNEYVPTRAEVLGELSKDALESGKRAATWSKNFALNAGLGFGVLASMPYAIPSYARGFANVTKTSGPSLNKPGENAGIGTGVITGFFSVLGQVGAYSYLAFHDHPEALLIPLGTNILSLASEGTRLIVKGVRNKANNARQRLIERNQGKNIETLM